MNNKFKSAGMIAAMVICWSLYYTFSKLAVNLTGSAFVSGFLLRAGAFVFLTVQLAITGTLKTLLRHEKGAIITLVLIGGFGFLLDMFANLGYAGGSLSTGTALLKCDVLMVNLASVIIYKKKLSVRDWLGTFIMLGGVLLVLGIDFRSFQINPTDVYFLLSAASVTANAFIIKKVQTKYNVNPDTISYYNNTVVLILFAAASFASGDLGVLASGNVPVSLWWIALAGGLAQAGIYFFYYRNLKTMEVWKVKLYLLFMPVVNLVIGSVFLSETIKGSSIFGILTVIAGAVIILAKEKQV